MWQKVEPGIYRRGGDSVTIRRARAGERPLWPWLAYGPTGDVMRRALPSGRSITVGGHSLTAAKLEVGYADATQTRE